MISSTQPNDQRADGVNTSPLYATRAVSLLSGRLSTASSSLGEGNSTNGDIELGTLYRDALAQNDNHQDNRSVASNGNDNTETEAESPQLTFRQRMTMRRNAWNAATQDARHSDHSRMIEPRLGCGMLGLFSLGTGMGLSLPIISIRSAVDACNQTSIGGCIGASIIAVPLSGIGIFYAGLGGLVLGATLHDVVCEMRGAYA